MKFLRYLFYIAVIVALGYFLVNIMTGRTEEKKTEDNDSEGGIVEEKDEKEENGNPNEVEDEKAGNESVTDFSNFSEDDQSVGDDAGDAEYTLAEISNEEMVGFHRFIFTLESKEEELPLVEASLNSSGGYIRLVLNNVTEDLSSIDYNSYETIDIEGITRLYHDVTANETEEVYSVGISQDTTFYLHEDGMNVILDVKYPGETEDGNYSDPTDFTTENIELEDTNTQGDVKITGYSWGVEDGAVKFIWETSSSSGNPTPQTAAVYDADEKKITVTFTDLLSDSVLGTDGSFELELAQAVDRVVGAKDVMNDVFIFEVSSDVEYRIYRETSPNQLVIEIK